MKKHPMQEIVLVKPAEGGRAVVRFRENKIVSAILDHATKHGFGLNEIAMGDFDYEDRRQLAQLIGYSVDGYSGLSYVTRKAYRELAEAIPEKLIKKTGFGE